MNNKIFIYLSIIFVVGLSAALVLPKIYTQQITTEETNKAQDKITIVASFYPIAHFAMAVGSDLVTVFNVTPSGAEPHDFEPTPQDIARATDADVFLYNGNGVDTWADRIAPELAANGVEVVRMSDAVELLPGMIDEHEEDDQESFDPHIWLDPLNALAEVQRITEALIVANPDNAEVYQHNAEAYIARLQTLDTAFNEGLAGCNLRTFVTAHNAFSYLAKRYNLTSLYISGLSPEDEPSAARMAAVADEAQKENIEYIFFEELVSPALADTIAQEIGAQTLVLDPIEGLSDEAIAAGEDYISVMQNNLTNLQIALECQ